MTDPMKLTALAIRDAAAKICDPLMTKCTCEACESIRRCRDLINALPLPDEAALTAAALTLPKVKALLEAANHARLAVAGFVPLSSAAHRLDNALAALATDQLAV